MKTRFRLTLIFLLSFATAHFRLSAQSTFGSEEELKTQAAKLFDDDQFEQAYPLYSQLLSLYPKDADYNYRLGVCMLFAGDDKEKPIPFLEYAAKNPSVEKEVFFYLARAYHLNYRFDDAIRYYNQYKAVASSAKAEKLMVDRQIEMCMNGKKLLRKITDLVVIDKKEMSREDFFRSYDISDIGGKLLVKPDEPAFKTAIDKKKKEKSIIYLATNNNQVFFSSYGDDPERGKDIYVIRKLPSGEWSKPQTLGYPVNTEYDEDYPFLHPNGKVLYFCSKGHNSMGGYDIFKTTLNEETNTWNKPVNMDFPINTPDDDILYVTNEDEKEAFFSSARSSVTGKTAVFHINVERKPIDIAIVKGHVIKTRDQQALDVKITVKDLADNTILGIYNARAENGVYIVNLPNGGKFLYTVEATGFATQSEVVEIPTQYEFKPLRQELSYEDGTNKLIIKNFFDEPADEASYLLALNYIKERAKMDTSTNPETSANASSTDAAKNNDSATTAIAAVSKTNDKNETGNNPKTSLSNADIIKIAYTDAADAAKEAKDLQEQADIALNLAKQKNDLAQNKTTEANQLMADASKMQDNEKKQAAMEEANAAIKESEELNQETVAAFNIARKLQFKAQAKNEEADLSMSYAKDLEAAVKSKNPETAMAKLDEQEKKLEELSKKNGAAEPDNIMSGLKVDEAIKKKELDQAMQAVSDVKQEMTDNETLIAGLKSDAEKTRREDLKKGILEQIEGLKQENVDKQQELADAQANLAKAQKDYNGVTNEMELVSSVVDKAKTGTSEQAAAAVADIDKAKLEQQVNAIKSNSDNTVASAAGNNAAGSQDTTAVATNSGENNGQQTNNGNDASATDYKKEFEQQLAATDKLDSEAARSAKKAEVLKAWNEAIVQDLNTQKAALKTEKDKSRKKDLTASIAALEKEQKDKKREADQAAAEASAIAKTNPVATNSGEQQTSNENSSTSGNNSGNTQETGSQASQVNTASYNEQIAAAEKITDPAERDKKKAEALLAWSTALDNDITAKQKQASATADPEMKALLEKKISDEQRVSQQKKDEAASLTNTANIASNAGNENRNPQATGNETVNNTEKTNGGNDIASNNSGNTAGNNTVENVNTPENISIEQKLNNDVSFAQKIPNEMVKESALNHAYSDYIAAANSSIAMKQDSLKKEKSRVRKDALKASIADLQADIREKQQLLDESSAHLTALKSTPVDTASVAENNTATSENENVLPENNAGTSTPAVVFNNPEAAKKNADAVQESKQADDLTEQANALKMQAAQASGESEKNELQNKANDLLDQAAQKRISAATLTSDAAAAQYSSGTNELSQLAAATTSGNSDELSMAEMMSDEAKVYAQKAGNARKLADNAKSPDDVQAALDEANRNETLALSKQQKATALYRKNNPGFVVKPATNNENAIAASGNRNPVSNGNTQSGNENNKNVSANNANVNKSTTQSGNGNNENVTANNAIVNKSTETNADTAGNNTQTGNIAENSNTASSGVNPANAAKDSAKDTASANNSAGNSGNNPATTGNNTSDTVAGNAGIAANANENNGNNVQNTGDNTNKQADNVASSENTAGSATNTSNASAGNTTLAVDKFERTSAPVYSAARPIPLNEKLPEGLVFKVQIGAFRNPIAPEVFKGMSPITAENTGTGLTRYTAGLFRKFVTADKAKQEIRDLGYRDAFVVAFYNGKRISMAQAQELSGEQIPVAVSENKTAEQTPVSTNTQQTGNAAANNTAVKDNGPVAEAKNVGAVAGLFYTVQVGVYSQEVPASKMHNCSPLYSEHVASGAVRYTTGVYDNIGRANEARALAYNAGIHDAFVSAYSNGKRMSMSEAAALVAQGNVTFATGPALNQLPVFGGGGATSQQPVSTGNAGNAQNTGHTQVTPPSDKNTGGTNSNPPSNPPVETTPVSPDVNNAAANNNSAQQKGVVFKVQIGAFRDEVPLEIANKFLKIAKMGIQNYKDENGLTVYTVGSYGSYEDAAKAREEVVKASGIADPFVVAFNDGKKISIDEAKKLLNQ